MVEVIDSDDDFDDYAGGEKVTSESFPITIPPHTLTVLITLSKQSDKNGDFEVLDSDEEEDADVEIKGEALVSFAEENKPQVIKHFKKKSMINTVPTLFDCAAKTIEVYMDSSDGLPSFFNLEEFQKVLPLLSGRKTLFNDTALR